MQQNSGLLLGAAIRNGFTSRKAAPCNRAAVFWEQPEQEVDSLCVMEHQRLISLGIPLMLDRDGDRRLITIL
jgi:hypothetical protein